MKPTPKSRETAKDLLKIHNGSCSVPRNGPLHLAFCEMQEAGKVRIEKTSDPKFVNITEAHETPNVQ